MSTECKNCGVSVFDAPLMRVNPKGEPGIFWCHECVKTHEPELFKNEMEEQTQAEKDIIQICYGGLRR